jgi:protein SCO1/2
MNGKFAYLAVVLVAALSAAAGVLVWNSMERGVPGEQPALLVLPEPRAVPAFELTDQFGRPFGPERLRGRWSLMFFGFTHCPDICPSSLYDLQRLSAGLAERGEPEHQVVFVSVDPERDTPARLKDYTAYFDPDFIAVTGPHEQLLPLTRKLGIAYRIEDHAPDAAGYNVDHSASVLLMDPEGRLYGVFPAPLDVERMNEQMRGLDPS